MIKKGRQIGTTLDKIRDDHRRRYEFAAKVAKNNGFNFAFDVGCGAGYGSFILANAGLRSVVATDIDPDAIKFAEENWNHPNIHHVAMDLKDLSIIMTDMVVMFEVIEHSEYAPAFLQAVSAWAKMIVGSVPNELVVPFAQSKHPQHVRHYTPFQIRETLEGAGFKDIVLYGQAGKRGHEAEVYSAEVFKARTIVFTARSAR